MLQALEPADIYHLWSDGSNARFATSDLKFRSKGTQQVSFVCVNGKTIPCQINNVVLVKEIINSSCVSRNSFQSLYIDSTVNKLSTRQKQKTSCLL